MNAQSRTEVFEDIAERILRAVGELREAVSSGTAADPKAASELADQMEGYAQQVLKGGLPPSRYVGSIDR